MSESKFVVDQEVIVSEAYATVNSAYVGKVGMVVYKFLSFEPFRYGLKFGNDDFLAIDEQYLQAVTDAPDSDDEDIPVLPHIPVFKPTDVEKQAAVDEIVAASTPAPEGGAGDDDRPYAVQAMSVIADLRRQLANSQSALETANNLIDQLHKDEQRLIAECDKLAAMRTDLEAIATGMTGDLTPANVANIALDKLTPTPQPAAAVAVDGGQVGSYVVCDECDGTGKLFVPQTSPVVLPDLDSAGQPSPAAATDAVMELLAALFDKSNYHVTGYEWLRAMRDAAGKSLDTEYAKEDMNAYVFMLAEVDNLFKVMDNAAAALARMRG